MTTRTHVPRAIGLAIGITTVAATVAAGVTTSAVAGFGGNSRHEFCVIDSVSVPHTCPSAVNPALAASDGFMPIHMDNQKIGSAVAAYWQAQTPTSEAPTVAKDKPMWELQTDSAYLTVYAHYCAPTFEDRAAMAVEPSGIEVAIYTDRFRVEYESDCRAFYLSEVATRIDQPTEQALIEAGRP